jgi:hypothetical protein
VKYHALKIPGVGVALNWFSVCAVLTYQWEAFTFPQEELQEGPSTSPDPSYIPQGHQEPNLDQQSKLNDLLRHFYLSKQQAERLESRLLQWYLLAKETRITPSRRGTKKFPHIRECRILFASAVM